MSEITKDFLDKLEEEFKKRYSSSKKIQSLEKKIREGKATCEDAFQYSKEVGNLRKLVLHDNITDDVLNDGYLGYSNALKLFDDSIHKNYELIDQYCQKAFTQVNKQAGINLKGVSVEYDQDKTNGIVECAVKGRYEKTRDETEEAVVTNAKSYYDSSVRKNANFQYKSGLNPKIIRTTVGKTCKWCQSLAGTYDYYDVSDTGNDVFRRHKNCDCLVVYSPKKGSYQDVWSKKAYNTKDYHKKQMDLIAFSNSKPSILTSSKSQEILNKQPKVDETDYQKVVEQLKKDGVAVERGKETDVYLDKNGMEGMVFHDIYGDAIIYHTKLSNSGMWEETLHIKQIKEGKIYPAGSKENYQCEVDAKEELIRRAKELKISDYEVRILKQQIEEYKILIERMNDE